METNTNPLYELYQQFPTTCQNTFNLTAHGWQAAIGAKILRAVSLKKTIKCLCVKPTGGSKSLIFNVVATILQGVMICICPLLSLLGADQTKKTLALVDTPSPSPPVTAFHLGKMKLKSRSKPSETNRFFFLLTRILTMFQVAFDSPPEAFSFFLVSSTFSIIFYSSSSEFSISELES